MFPQLYHTHHNNHLEDLPFWLDLAAGASGYVLELGCGTGRVLIPLAKAAYHCIGIDNNLAMLKFLRANIRSQIQPPPLLIQSDISQFALRMRFPLIILPCNTFSTLDGEHRKACLCCVQSHLKPGGTFAVALPNPDVLRHLPAVSELEFEEEFIHPETSNPVQVSSSWQRTKNQFTLTWLYDHLHPNGTVERLTVETSHQLISAEKYLDEMRQAGLMILETCGDFDRSVYSVDSPHLIILAGSTEY